MKLQDIVIVAAVRTPLGKFGGTLKNLKTYELGAIALKGACKKISLDPKHLGEVIMGCCRQAGNGSNPGRSAALLAGMPASAPTHTINMACPSGMKALFLAVQAVRLGNAEIAAAGAMESMSSIPYLIKNCRWQGFKMGHQQIEDGWIDSIDPLVGMPLGFAAENLVHKYKLTREELDLVAFQSHQKAAQATRQGWFKDEIVPVSASDKSAKKEIILGKDECVRPDTSLEKLAALLGAFDTDGFLTAGNTSCLSDGATALIVTSKKKAKELGLTPLFSLVEEVSIGCDPKDFAESPAFAAEAVLKKRGLSINDIELLEVNEAFACQMLANEKYLNWDREKVNVHGGAIALGHPSAVSGGRVVVTLYHAMRRLNKEIGLASVGGAGGMSTALIIKRET